MQTDNEITNNNNLAQPKHYIDALIKQGLWQEAFIRAQNDVETSLKIMHSFLIDNYDVYERHKDDDPDVDDTAGLWFDSFINVSTVEFLPSINNLMILFGIIINKLDSVDAVLNYDVELEKIRDTINAILQEE
ncbi:MAG: hypothetical protein J6P64_03630 [Bacteroidales bacterium]|nr:hypothetical protein [Bacteroidales bacterium]